MADRRDEPIAATGRDASCPAAGSAPHTCPTCGLELAPGTIRCPRCNTFVLAGCAGSCAGCGAKGCGARH